MNLTALNFTRDPSLAIQMIIDAATPKDGYYSMINIVQKRKGKFIPKGYLCTNSPETFRPIVLKKSNMYLTKNGMKKSKTWNNDDLSTLHNIVIDIDCHFDELPYERVDDAVYTLHELLLSENIFPNVFNVTGRGIQLWWFIHPLPATDPILHCYNAVVERFMVTINKIIKEKLPAILKEQKLHMSPQIYKKYESLTFFHVDVSPSKKASGLIRFPGSYNTRTGRYGKFSYQHTERIDILEEYFDEPVKKKEPISKKFNLKNYDKDLAKYRESVFHNLVELRKNKGIVGYRDIILHYLASAYISSGYSNEDTMDAVMSLNCLFEHPMSEHEVRTYMSTTLKKGYWYTNATIIDTLEITEEEQVKLGFYKSNKKTKAVVNRCHKKERNNSILELHNEGKTQIEIARSLGISQSTVCRCLNKHGIVKKTKMYRRKYFVKDIIRRLRLTTGTKVVRCRHISVQKRIQDSENIKYAITAINNLTKAKNKASPADVKEKSYKGLPEIKICKINPIY